MRFSLAKTRIGICFNMWEGQVHVQAPKGAARDPKLEQAIEAAYQAFFDTYFQRSDIVPGKENPTQ